MSSSSSWHGWATATAFDELIRRHDDRMRGLAYRLLADRHGMDDALQESYLKAYRALDRFRAGSDFGTWLYRITYNACIDELRKRKRSPVSSEDPVDPVSSSPGPERVVSASETVRAALATLPIDQRVTVVLVDGEGFDHREAAKILGVQPGTVASRLHRARAALRQHPRGGGAVTEPVEPDVFVRTALQLLPVPQHHDGFWTDLRTALDAEPAPGKAKPARRAPLAAVAPAPKVAPKAAEPDEPAPPPAVKVVELVRQPVGVLPPGIRRRSNVVLSAVAVAAAVVVVVAGTTLVRERSGGVTDTTTELADATDQPDDTAASSTSTSISTLTRIRVGGGAHQRRAGVGRRPEHRAISTPRWAAMGPASQAFWGSRSAFDAERTGLAEGYGAWSGATPGRGVRHLADGERRRRGRRRDPRGHDRAGGQPSAPGRRLPGPGRRRRGAARALCLRRRAGDRGARSPCPTAAPARSCNPTTSWSWSCPAASTPR